MAYRHSLMKCLDTFGQSAMSSITESGRLCSIMMIMINGESPAHNGILPAIKKIYVFKTLLSLIK